MPDFIVQIFSKFLLFIVCMQLSGCAQQMQLASNDSKPLEVSKIVSVDLNDLKLQNLLSYDIYVQGSSLHALFAATRDGSKQPYIGYLHSENNGQLWSKPIEIPLVANATLESVLGNDVQIAADGKSLLAIVQLTGEIPGMGPLTVMHSEDGGQTWTSGANPTASEIDQSHPELIADPQGHYHLVWLDDRDENGYQGVRYARTEDNGQHWKLTQTVDDSSCSCCWNRLWLGKEGSVNLLYRDMEPRDMALAKSMDDGQTWRRLATVGEFNWVFDGCPHNGGALAGAEDKKLHALVWTGLENKAGLYYLNSVDNGEHWSVPQAMGGGTLAFHSDIAVLDEKHLLAIWDAMGAEGSVVMVSESFDNGSHWSAARQLSAKASSASFPRIVASDSRVLALWAEQKSGDFKQWMTAILE
jgi:hypothetical protein